MQRDRSGNLPPAGCIRGGDALRPPWDPPIVQDKAAALAPEQRWQGLCEVAGYWCSFDVYIQAPQDWQDVEIRAVASELDLSTEVARLRVSDIQHPELGRAAVPGAGGTIQGSLLRITGRPCAKFSVQALGDGTRRAEAKFYIRASGPEALPADRNARAQTSPFASRAQALNVTLGVPVGTTALAFTPAALLASANARADRVYLTAVSITSHDDAVRELALQTNNASTGIVSRRRVYLVGGDPNRAIPTIETFSYALRPDRDDRWEVTLSGTNLTGHRLNVSGFAE